MKKLTEISFVADDLNLYLCTLRKMRKPSRFFRSMRSRKNSFWKNWEKSIFRCARRMPESWRTGKKRRVRGKERMRMWCYEKRLQFPVNIKRTCAKTAKLIISQYGGPDGELSASLRYLSQALYHAVKKRGRPAHGYRHGELGHMEMICAMVYQLTKDLSVEEVEKEGFAPYYIDHTTGIWPQAAAGLPFSAVEFQSKGDAVTDLMENLAAEQKARTVYDNLLRVHQRT